MNNQDSNDSRESRSIDKNKSIRGQSRSRTRGGGKNFLSRRVQQSVIDQDNKTKTILDENEQRSKKAQRNETKISEHIEKGKTFVSKFFRGFEQVKRGNIEVKIDDTLPERISEVYYDRINTEAESEARVLHVDERQPYVEQRVQRFCAGITLGVSLKLYKSSTDLEKASNMNLNVLHHSKIQLPEKAAVLVNQLGKTDLKDDNRIRVQNQHLACKRMLIKAINYSKTEDQLAPFLTNADSNGLTCAHLRQFVSGNNFHKMIDNTLKSVNLLKQLGKYFFEEQSKNNYQLEVNSTTVNNNQPSAQVRFSIKLPEFNFTNPTKERIIEYLNNPIFSMDLNRHFNWTDQNVVTNVVCSLVFQIATASWIRRPNRRMSELDNQFAGTFIANVTFLNVMNAAGIWNINNFIDDTDINELAGDLIHTWNTSDVQLYSRILNMKEISFSEFGTDAQMVLIDKNNLNLQAANTFRGVPRCNITQKAKAETPMKISETGATFGVMCRMIDKIHLTNDFRVNHDGNNRNILREFLKSDIRN